VLRLSLFPSPLGFGIEALRLSASVHVWGETALPALQEVSRPR